MTTSEPQNLEHSGRLASRSPLRATVFAAVAAFALAIAGQAFAAVTPHLVVTTTKSATSSVLSISASRQQSDSVAGKIAFYVPTGFTLNAPVGGSAVGSASATVVSRDVDAATEQAMTGTVVAIGATDPAVAYENANCDTNTHLTAWMVQLNGTTGAFNFPVFVDATTGTDTTLGPYVLVACLRSPDLPQGTTGRSPNGDVLDALSLTLKPFTYPTAAGTFRWRSLWTPYTTGTATMNAAGAVEAQSLITSPPGVLSIVGKKATTHAKGKTKVLLTISGLLLVGGEPEGTATVAIRHGITKTKLTSLGTVKTSAAGTLSKVVVLTKPSMYFQTSATVAAKDLGAAGCTPTFGAGIACLDATVGTAHVLSGVMHITR